MIGNAEMKIALHLCKAIFNLAPQPGLEPEQVLSNAADNFETCNLNAIDHDRLVDVLNIYKGRMCICGQ